MKDGKTVSIEFESKSDHLQTHLTFGGWYKYEFNDRHMVIEEDESNYYLFSRLRYEGEFRKRDLTPDYTLPKKDYEVDGNPNGRWDGIKIKKLDLDYCVAWIVNEKDKKRVEYEKVKFIELKSNPIIRQFLKTSGLF